MKVQHRIMTTSQHPTPPDHTDIAIIGVVPAGLQAALTAGRVRRQATLFDDGTYRNATVSHMHNVLTHEGTPPADFRAVARRELTAYDTVSVREERVKTIERDGDDFRLTLTSGDVRTAYAACSPPGSATSCRPSPACRRCGATARRNAPSATRSSSPASGSAHREAAHAHGEHGQGVSAVPPDPSRDDEEDEAWQRQNARNIPVCRVRGAAVPVAFACGLGGVGLGGGGDEQLRQQARNISGEPECVAAQRHTDNRQEDTHNETRRLRGCCATPFARLGSPEVMSRTSEATAARS